MPPSSHAPSPLISENPGLDGRKRYFTSSLAIVPDTEGIVEDMSWFRVGYVPTREEYDISRNGTPTPKIGVFEYSKHCALPWESQNIQSNPTVSQKQRTLGAKATIPGDHYGQQGLGKETSDAPTNLAESSTGLGLHSPDPIGSAMVAQPRLPRSKGSPSSSTTFSGSSTPGTESHIDETKFRIIDGVVFHVANKIKVVFALARGMQSETSVPPASNETSNSSMGTTSATGSDRRRAKKRKVTDGNNGGTDDDEDPEPPRDPEPGQEDDQGLAYACPYFKYNPRMYRTARNCPGPGWPSVYRVK